LATPDFGMNISDWSKFVIKKSDLTEKGFELFKLCHGHWNVAYGQEHTNRHLVQWKRSLKELKHDD
jgi:hypothetical protein